MLGRGFDIFRRGSGFLKGVSQTLKRRRFVFLKGGGWVRVSPNVSFRLMNDVFRFFCSRVGCLSRVLFWGGWALFGVFRGVGVCSFSPGVTVTEKNDGGVIPRFSSL